MSIEENKRLALRYFETLHKPDVEAAFALIAPDVVCWVPTDKAGGMTLTRNEMIQGAHASFKAFVQRPVVKQTVVAAEGDRVCVEVESRGGRTQGGAAYDNDYFIWLRMRDGLIVEFREYYNPILAADLIAELQMASK